MNWEALKMTDKAPYFYCKRTSGSQFQDGTVTFY